MKTILVLSILFSTIAWLPVGAELTETDLENIRQILREELQEAFRDTHVAFDEIEATVDEIDARFDSINRNLDRMQITLRIAMVLVVGAGIFNWMSVFKSWRSR